MRLKTCVVLGLMLIGGGGTALMSAPGATSGSTSREVGPPGKIAALEARIAALEARLQELERRPVLVTTAPLAVPNAYQPGMEPRPVVPHTWKRGDINGMPFYTLPLQGAGASTAGSR